MIPILNEVLDANKDYADSFDKADLAMPPARQFAILTCMMPMLFVMLAVEQVTMRFAH